MRKPILLVLILIVICTPLYAASSLKGLTGTDEEMELFRLIEESKFVKAREIAENILKRDGDSYVANYIMGVVIRRAEANLPKAYFYLGRAKSSYERRYGKKGADEKTWRWHLFILYELIETAAEMDLYEKQLEYLKAHDAAYIPEQTAYYAWPLMKLGRLSEAREQISQALKKSKSERDKIVALNSLGAIESEIDNREEAYRIFNEARSKAKDARVFVVLNKNFASAALGLLKFDESEKEYIKASSRGTDSVQTSNPWQNLASLYIEEGRFDEAYGAMKNMIEWGLEREPYLDQQCISGEEQVKAFFLLTCGYAEQAYLLTKRLVDSPDRLGHTAEKKFQALGSLSFLHLLAIEDYLKMLKEKLTWAGWKEKPGLICNIQSLSLQKMLLKSRLKCIIISNNALAPNLIPYHTNGIGSYEFLEPDLAGIIGKGLIEAEIADIRKNYKYKALSEPYLREFEGEIAFRWHNHSRALECFREAEANLPPQEKPLLARIWAITGQIEEGSGNFEKSLSSYQRAYRIYPSIFRHLGIRLPVTISAEGEDPVVIRAKKILKKSPRFKIRDGAFTIKLETMGNRVRGALLDDRGNTMMTASTAKTGDVKKDTKIFLEELHLKAFLSPISASATDINSLDGSNLKGDQMRQDIKDLFFEKTGKAKGKVGGEK